MTGKKASNHVPRPQGDTRSRIRETAVELFASQGVDRTSLREIAERLQITKAALYYHFPSKTDLLREILQPLFDDVDELLGAAAQESDLAPRELLGRYFDVTARHRALFLALIYDTGTLAELDVINRIFIWRDGIQRLLVGPEPGPTEVAACTLAIGGLQDCAVTVGEDAVSAEFREAALDAACRALGMEAR